MWFPQRSALTVLLAGLVVHAAALTFAHWRTGRIDGYAFNSLDAGEYYGLARNMARHGVFSLSEEPPLKPDTWRTPGYPLFLAGVMLLGGDSPAVLVIVQQLLSILNVLLVFWIAKVHISERRALIAALLFLIEPYHLWYSLWLMSTTFFMTVLLLTWYAWQKTMQTSRWPWMLLLGVLCGFAVLVRPLAGLIPFALIIGLTIMVIRAYEPRAAAKRLCRARADVRAPGIARKPRTAAQVRWLALPIFSISCALMVGLWMLRNYCVAGHFTLSSQSGVVLAYFKATEVVLWREGRTADRYLETTLDPAKRPQPHPVWEQIDERLRSEFPSLPADVRAALRWQNLAQGNKTAADPFAVSRALSEIGRSYLAASPLSTARCCLARCGSILIFPLNLALRPPAGVNGTRLGWLAVGLPYLALLICVLIRIVRGGFTFAQTYFPLAGTVALLLATTPQLDPRFRVPMIPLLLIFALLPRPESSSPTDAVGTA